MMNGKTIILKYRKVLSLFDNDKFQVRYKKIEMRGVKRFSFQNKLEKET